MSNSFQTFSLGYIKPTYFGQDTIGTLKGKAVTLSVSLTNMALCAAHSPYGSKELIVNFDTDNIPLTHLARVVEGIVTDIEAVFDGAEPELKDISGYQYRMMKALAENIAEFITVNREYSLPDVMQIVSSLPSNLIKAIVTPVTH